MKTINEIGLEFRVHPVQVGQWKKEIQEQAGTLFVTTQVLPYFSFPLKGRGLLWLF